MIVWLAQNIGTIIILMGLIATVAAIVYVLIKDKKQGKSTCGGNCAHCKMCTACKGEKNGENKCKKTT